MFHKVVLRAPYNYDTDKASDDAALSMPEDEPILTQQQFKEESDINTIIERFGLGVPLPDVVSVPVSGDFTGITDFHSAMNAVREAQENFMELPAQLRARFNNDPQRLMDFVADDSNIDEARKLGLLKPPVEVPRDMVTAVDELAAKLVPPDSAAKPKS